MYQFIHYHPWILALILISLITLCGALTITEGKAEELPAAAVPSITVHSLYRVISEVITPSDEPFDLQIAECLRVNIDVASLPESVTTIDAELHFPALPKKLKSILLYDGKHAIPARWHWTDENAIYVSFEKEDIEKLDHTRPFYLFLFATQ